ncbi:hypothetical protein J2TS4_26510 [Paenibacillus sp. J2TS4]|nr:hypothetical protein J2TS4_26510 [Paenibacillus sp. J2TS4]
MTVVNNVGGKRIAVDIAEPKEDRVIRTKFAASNEFKFGRGSASAVWGSNPCLIIDKIPIYIEKWILGKEKDKQIQKLEEEGHQYSENQIMV